MVDGVLALSCQNVIVSICKGKYNRSSIKHLYIAILFVFIHTTLLYTHILPPYLTHYCSGDLGTLSLGIPYHTWNGHKGC